MISIVNYGMGNIGSIRNALNYLNLQNRVVTTAPEILQADKLILPGVGSFAKAMENIRNLGILESLNEAVHSTGTPILGICLGMQLLADKGDEDGPSAGLGFIRGRVRHFSIGRELKLPHIGFNLANFSSSNRKLFDGLKDTADFYFIHNYVFDCDRPEDIAASTTYGETFVSGVARHNVYGVQFHPEKSQSNGLTVLKNFGAL